MLRDFFRFVKMFDQADIELNYYKMVLVLGYT
jgi:hypothetical protein